MVPFQAYPKEKCSKYRFPLTEDSFQHLLVPRQYKNYSIQSKIVQILKFLHFFPHRIGGEKARQFQSCNYF